MVVSYNGSAVQRSASTVVGLQANESFTSKLSDDVILITVHTGAEVRGECGVNKERDELVEGFCEKVGKNTNDDQQYNNQRNFGTKLLYQL